MKLNEIGRCFNDRIEHDVIMHIGGFIAYKLGGDLDEDIPDNRWNELLSHGGLIKASATLTEYLKLLLEIFKVNFECDVKYLLMLLNEACDENQFIEGRTWTV